MAGREGKKPPYLSKTIDDISKVYEDISMAVRNAIKEPAIAARPAELGSVMLILDEALMSSEGFRRIFRVVKGKAKRIVSVYIPEEEDIISRLRELKEDRDTIMKELRELEAERENKILSELRKLGRDEGVAIDVEIMHKPRISTLLEICEREKPAMVVMSKNYSKEAGEDVSHVVSELVKKLSCPLLLVE